MEKQILVIDDDQAIANLVHIHLKQEGYEVAICHNGTEGLDYLISHDIQLVILDIMMPGIDGLEVLRRIRERWNIPILMLSAKSQDMDKVLGLGLGADDYITKPFSPMELIARVKAQLRRYHYLNNQIQNKPSEDKLVINDLQIFPELHQVYLGEERINLTPTEFSILLLLAKQPGKVFNSESIFEAVWGEKYLEANNTVMVHIWRLREKLESNPKEPKYIQTVWGVGYKIEN